MMISFCFICVFVLINKVSLQETVEAVIGGSVVLPCSSSQHDLQLQNTEVHWRHNKSKIVYDIIKGSNSQEQQDPEYKNRAEAFPEEYERGNFSIKLNNLQFTDTGKYSCLITPSDEQKTVQLIINESTAEEGIKSTEEEKHEATEAGSEEKPSAWIRGGIASSVVVVIVVVVGFIAYFRKKSSNSHRPSEHGIGSDTHEVEHIMNHNVTADNNDNAVST